MSWLFKNPVVIMKEIMPWQFKDPINSGLAQFYHANQTVKVGLKVKKIKLPQMNFFLEKQLIKLPCTYWPLSFCKILKIFLGPVQSYEDVPFLGLKWLICHEQNFFGTNRYYFHLPIGPFHCAKFKKILTADPVMSMHHFWAQHGPFARNNFFFQKSLISLLSTY